MRLPTADPANAGAAAAPPSWPLLIWLCEDGQSLDDAIALWEPVVGRECALLALEPNWPFQGEDGVRRGRWFFPGEAIEGGGLAAAAIERALGVVARDEPGGDAPSLPVDRARVVVAGERAGATMALCAARLAARSSFSVLAFAPAAQEELAQMSLPLPPGREQPTRGSRRGTRSSRATASCGSSPPCRGSGSTSPGRARWRRWTGSRSTPCAARSGSRRSREAAAPSFSTRTLSRGIISTRTVRLARSVSRVSNTGSLSSCMSRL